MPKGEHHIGKKPKNGFTKDKNPMKDKAIIEKKVKSQVENTKKKRVLKDLLTTIAKNGIYEGQIEEAAALYGITAEEVTLSLLMDAGMIKRSLNPIDNTAVQAYMAIKKVAGEIIDKQMPVDQNGDLIKRGKDGVTYIVTIGDNI